MAMDNETLRYLGATAYIAATFNMRDSSDKISDALTEARPNDPEAHVLAAVAKLQSGQAAASAKILQDKVLALDPDHAAAKAYLALAQGVLGNMSERNRLAQEVIDANDDQGAVQLARETLDS